jgi:hypothetical protein
MCTVTVVHAGATWRLVCNRDERRTRAGAHPPFITRAGSLQLLAPQDPVGGGTWVAVNSAGLAFALLNGDGGAPAGRRSRGLVIHGVAASTTTADVADAFARLDLESFAPFRLLVADDRGIAEFVSDATDWDVRLHSTAAPRLFTSSSLGDALVEGPRRALFDQMFVAGADLVARQDAFHGHRWRDRPAVSVHMSRPDACTVSTTMVEVTRREVRMSYEPAHDRIGTHVGLAISRHGGAHGPAHWSRSEHAAV